MTIDEIVRLIQAVSDNGLTSFVYEEGEERLILKKKKKKNVAQAPVAPVMSPVAVAVPTAEAGFAGMKQDGEAAAREDSAKKDSQEKAVDIGSDKVVTSPLVGTFYSAPSPDAKAFVQVGDTVKRGQVLGIIEAMKLMNEIESEYDGVVEAVLVENENVVEYGQPLFRIR